MTRRVRLPLRGGAHSLADRVKAAGGRLSAGLHALAGSRSGGALGILFYHRVAPVYPGVPPPALNVTPERFRAQIEGLLAKGYRFLSLAEAVARHRRGEAVPPRSVVLTFDDGFAGLYAYAWPVLREHAVPATIFVVTGYVGRQVPMGFDAWGMTHHAATPDTAWRSLTWDECREMAATGLIEIAAHTHTHAVFRDAPGALRADLLTCFEHLDREMGEGSRLFAFPFGDPFLGYVQPALLEAARAAGASCALTTRTALVRSGESPFGWGRLEVVEQDTPATLGAKLEGWYNWMRPVRNLAHRVVPW